MPPTPLTQVAFWTYSNLGRVGGAYLLVSHLFAFSYSLRGSCGKNAGVDSRFQLQWIMFCQNSSL